MLLIWYFLSLVQLPSVICILCDSTSSLPPGAPSNAVCCETMCSWFPESSCKSGYRYDSDYGRQSTICTLSLYWVRCCKPWDCVLERTTTATSICKKDCFITYEVKKVNDAGFGGKSCSDVAKQSNFLSSSASPSGYVYKTLCFSGACKASHCGKFPPQTAPTTVSSLCPSGIECLPGFPIVGSGFEAWTGSLKKSIVAYSFNKTNTYNGKRVPDQQQVSSDNHIDIGVNVETFDSVDSYRKSIGIHIGLDVMLRGIPLGGSFDMSKKYSQYGSVSSKLFKAVKKASLWRTTLSVTDLDHMISEFKTAVQNLPSYYYSYRAHLFFIEKFGTHIVSQATFGGMYIMESAMCSFLYKSSKSDKFKLMADLGWGRPWGKSRGHFNTRTGTLAARDTGEEQLIGHIAIKIYGGNPNKLCCQSKNCTWEYWYKDVANKPYPISYRVMPISDVLRSNPKYYKKADNLDKAINEYLEKRASSVVKGSTLKCPMPHPARRPSCGVIIVPLKLIWFSTMAALVLKSICLRS